MGGDDGATILDNALSSKPQLVVIEPTDTAFKTSGCQPWLAANDQTPSPDAPLGWRSCNLPLSRRAERFGGAVRQRPVAAFVMSVPRTGFFYRLSFLSAFR